PEAQTLFFATGDAALKDKNLRIVLSSSLNRTAVLNHATGGQGLPITQPLLPGQIGYSTKYAPPPLSAAAAGAALDAGGWVQAKPGAVRTNAGVPLQLHLLTLRGGELERAAGEIKRQWGQLCVVLHATTT